MTVTHDITEGVHSPLGASGAFIWMNCTGAPALLRKYKDKYGQDSLEEDNEDAALGTAAHEILARCLTKQTEPWEYLGEKIKVKSWEFEVDQEMTDAVLVAVGVVEKLLGEYSVEHATAGPPSKHIEERLQHSEHRILFGTVDAGFAVVYDPYEAFLDIVDYKHGVGVTVEPHTPQVKYYAALLVDRLIKSGAVANFVNFKRIRLYVVQPRNPHPKGPVRMVELTGDELEDWVKLELIPKMQETFSDNPVVTLGPWCKYCKVAAVCIARQEELQQFDTSLKPSEMSGDELGDMIVKADRIADLRKAMWNTAMARVLNGQKVKGVKCVRGVTHRKWKDDVEKKIVAEYKGDKSLLYSKPELLSPPQLEKIPDGKVLVSKYAFTPEGPYTIAKLSDKRQAVPPPKRLMDQYEDSLANLDAPVDLSDI